MSFPPEKEFVIGDLVKVIDTEESPSEWAIFQIIAEDIGHYCLKPPDKEAYEPFWIVPPEIYPVS